MLMTFCKPITTQIHLENSTSYSGALTSESPTFSRNDITAGFYYQAIRITASVTGVYDIRSISNMDAYGSLYQPTFNPSDPLTNLVLRNDDGAGSVQFRISATLQAGSTCVLVFTTNAPNVQGSFVVTVTDPSRVGMVRIDGPVTASPSPASTSPSTTTKVTPTTRESNISFH